MKRIVFVALLAAAGCSKKSPDCDGSIGKGMDSFAASVKTSGLNPQMQAARMDVVTKLRGTLTQRCNDDKWPAEVVSCFATAGSMKGMQACQADLSNEQRTRLLTEIRQIMMGSGSMRMPGGVGVPGHPPTLAPGGAGSGAPETSGGGMPGSHDSPAPAPAGSASAPVGSAGAPAGSGAAPSPATARAAGPGAAAPAAGSGGW
jgi:hypothetical protein